MKIAGEIKNNSITILHVFTDDKFFDGTSRFFQALPNVNNLFCYYSPKQKPFNYIKNKERITYYTNWDEYTSLFKNPDINIIYFHSIPINYYKLFNYIDPHKIVIWWCWGYDIYNSYGFLKPFIELDLYKPQTKHITSKGKILKIIFHYIKSLALIKYKKMILNRVDYFSPVIPIEYELMKNNPQFKAKPFMLESGPGLGYTNKNELTCKNKAQNILIGNSLTLTNNHLDILENIKNIKLPNDRTYIVPINYGNGFDKNILKIKAQKIPAQFKWLESFVPKLEYQELFNSITHAIFGHIRQQGMGNINICFKNGIKVYLYKDSIIYKQLKMKGYRIFSIEDELNIESLSEVLPEKDALHNYELFYKISNNKIEKTISELETMIHDKNKI